MGRNANAHSKRSNPALWFMGISTARPQFRASPDCEYLLLVGTRPSPMIRPSRVENRPNGRGRGGVVLTTLGGHEH